MWLKVWCQRLLALVSFKIDPSSQLIGLLQVPKLLTLGVRFWTRPHLHGIGATMHRPMLSVLLSYTHSGRWTMYLQLWSHQVEIRKAAFYHILSVDYHIYIYIYIYVYHIYHLQHLWSPLCLRFPTRDATASHCLGGAPLAQPRWPSNKCRLVFGVEVPEHGCESMVNPWLIHG